MARMGAEDRPMPKAGSLPASYSSRRRWTEAEARTVLAAQGASGLSVAAFAAREGIDTQRLYSWRRRLDRPVEAEVAPSFIEVRHAGGKELVEVLLRSGQVLRVADSIDPRVLRRLVDALERASFC
jgi:transposase